MDTIYPNEEELQFRKKKYGGKYNMFILSILRACNLVFVIYYHYFIIKMFFLNNEFKIFTKIVIL